MMVAVILTDRADWQLSEWIECCHSGNGVAGLYHGNNPAAWGFPRNYFQSMPVAQWGGVYAGPVILPTPGGGREE